MQFPQFPPHRAKLVESDPRQVPAFWSAPTVRMRWQGAGDANGVDNGETDGRFTQWDSPIFDLRADLRDMQGQSADNPNLGVSPIYAPGGSLFVFLNILTPGGTEFLENMNINVWEEAHPWNPYERRPITTEQNITTVFTTATRPYGPTTAPERGLSGISIHTPPSGSGGPVRYWQLRMIIRRFDQLADPQIAVSASFY